MFRFLKTIAALAALLALLALPALAECWTSPGDLYWHAVRDCLGTDHPNAVHADDDRLYPCPVCVQDETDYGDPVAFVRKDILLLCIPDQWMASLQEEDYDGIPWEPYEDWGKGDKAERMLAEDLHGEAYQRALTERAQGIDAEAPILCPQFYSYDGVCLCRRHLGGAWYIAYRFADEEWDSYRSSELTFHHNVLRGTLSVSRDSVYELYNREQPFRLPDDLPDAQAAFTAGSGDLALTLFGGDAGHFLELRERDADPDLLETVSLSIGDHAPDVELEGCMDGVDGVYVVALTDAEIARVTGGAPVALHHDWIDPEAFGDSDYAIAEKGTAGTCVVDREGRFIVPPIGEYSQRILRHGDTFFVKDVSGSRLGSFLDDVISEKLRVLRVESGEVTELMALENDDMIVFTEGEAFNDAVFAMEFYGYGEEDGPSSTWLIFDMDTGKQLCAVPANYDDPVSPTAELKVGYPLQSGKPQRVIFYGYGEHDVEVHWLADNHGNRVSENFQMLDAMLWRGDTGVYLAQTFDHSEVSGYPNGAQYGFFRWNDGREQDFSAGFDGRPWYGEHWRCGLVDQDGHALTPIEYVKVTQVTETRIDLEAPDGRVDIYEIE